jgi:hypothetical protein
VLLLLAPAAFGSRLGGRGRGRGWRWHLGGTQADAVLGEAQPRLSVAFVGVRSGFSADSMECAVAPWAGMAAVRADGGVARGAHDHAFRFGGDLVRAESRQLGISTSAAQSAVSSQQSAVSSQQSAVSSRHAHRTSARSAGMAKSRSVTFDSALMYAKQKGRNVCTFLNDC